jgi:hypothetical protein
VTPSLDNRSRAPLVLCALVLPYVAVALVFATQSRPNIDEGMFLTAGRLVADGRLPYRDFPFAQAPLLAYAFAAAPDWFGSPLLGGRMLALVAGAVGMASALWLARRVAGDFAALITLLLTLATLPSLWVGATVRAQALATPLLLLGVATMALRGGGALRSGLPSALLLVSTSLRLTNLPVFAAVFAWSCWRLRSTPARMARVAGAIAALALLLGAPALRAPAQAWFQVVSAQLARDERFGFVSSPDLAERLGRVLAAYLDLLPDAASIVLLALGLAASGLWCARREWRPNAVEPFADPVTAQLALALLGALAFAPHLALGNAFIEYLIPLWALLAPAVGIGLASQLDRRGVRGAGRSAVALALVGFAAVNFVRTREIWIGTGSASLASFQRVGADLARLGGPRCTMLTLETELAVEAGCRVLPGLEYSFFSYFAELPSDEAQRRGVANLAALRDRVSDVRPDLIVLAPGHAHLLLGPHLGAPPEHPRPRIPGSLDPLEFLGPLARHYELYGHPAIPSGARRPGERDVIPLRVYVRKWQ